MNNEEQLTFSEDPLLPGINKAFRYLENGEFDQATTLFNSLIDSNPDYPGLTEGYRTSRFWGNRQNEFSNLSDGKKSADFLMKEWSDFQKYAMDKNLTHSTAYKSVQKYIFYTASEHYKTAFKNEENPTDNFNLLVNLATCFTGLDEYSRAIETLEYIRSAYKSNTIITAMLAESYYHIGEVPKSMMLFREAFFVNPQELNISQIKSKPVIELFNIAKNNISSEQDPREWIPIYGYIMDIFYVKQQLSRQTVEMIKKDIYNLEKSFQMMSKDKLNETNIVPRLINKYLWMYDYFSFQTYDFDALTDIRKRLIKMNKSIFEPYFQKKKD